jgi:hypothetical protein
MKTVIAQQFFLNSPAPNFMKFFSAVLKMLGAYTQTDEAVLPGPV